MGLFDGTADNSGLMSIFANPQTAGMLGMSQGLLAAAGPSRIPVTMGQALSSGLGGMQQGYGNAVANQRQLLQLQAMQGLMGGTSGQQQPPQSAQPDPTMAQGAPVSGGANVGGMSGLSAGLGGMAPQMPVQQPGPAQSGPSIYGRTPQQLFQQGMLMNMAGMQGGGDLMRIAVEHDPSIAYSMPTDQMKNANYAFGPGQQAQDAVRGVLNKDATVIGRAGGYAQNGITGQTTWFPNVPAGGMPVMGANGQPTGAVALQPGATDIASAMAAAKTGGEGSQLPFTTGVDAQGNPLPVMSRTQAATGNLPLPLRNNNPGAVSPGGTVAQYPDMQTGLKAMDNNLASYASDPKASTIGGAITKWVGSAPNAPAYISDVTSRLGIPANTPFDAKNPAQRQALGTAIMLHENGPSAVFGAGQPQSAAPQGSAIYAAPPMGAQTAIENTAKDNAGNYNNLSQFASASPDRVNTLDNMMALAQGTTKFGPGWEGRLDRMAQINSYLPSGMSFGSDNAANAQTFQKYASYLVQQYQRAMGGHQTDAQLNTVIHGTPNPEMLNQTMTEVIPKLKAMELAVQAKATAGDSWMAQHQNNATNYNQFESMWRQNYDPRIYQMQQMTPDQRAVFMKTQPDANALRTKAATALQNGWVQ